VTGRSTRHQPADGAPEITSAIQSVFRYLTASPTGELRALLVAADAGAAILRLMRARRARQGGKARAIGGQMNALLDSATIEALYEASNAGVEIDLIAARLCSLRPA